MERLPLRLLLIGWMLLSGFVALAQQVGDSPEAVVSALGQPSMKRTSGERETWIYSGGKKVVFVNGKVAETEVNEREVRIVEQQREQQRATERAKERVTALKEGRVTFGEKAVPARTIVIGIFIIGALAYAGINSVAASNRTVGIAVYALVCVLTLGIIVVDWNTTQLLIRMMSAEAGVAIEGMSYAGLAIGTVVSVAMLYFMARGSTWGFGLYCLGALPAIGAAVFAIFGSHPWTLVIPAAMKIVAVALLLTSPVQGFLNRHHKSVADTIRELDRGTLAANKRKG